MTDTTIVALATGMALAAGIDLRRVCVLVAALVLPMVVAVLVIWLALRQRKAAGNRAALFTEGVAAELRAGAVLRDALMAAARAVGFEISGDTVESMTTEIAEQLPEIASELRSAVSAAAHSGSHVADLFDEIGAVAIAQSEVSREVSVATAPAKVTAAVFAGAPALYLIAQMRSGGFTSLISSPGQQVSGLLGLGLFLAGLAAVLFILWRAS